jgi:hypothetical protein
MTSARTSSSATGKTTICTCWPGYPPKVAVSSLVNSLKRRLGQETAPEAQRADAPGAPMGASLPRRIMPQSTARHHHAVSKEPARTWPA